MKARGWGFLGRSFVVAALIGGFLSFSGAYGTEPIPMLPRTAMMVMAALVATALGSASFRLASTWPWVGDSRWRQGLAAGVLMTLPMAAFTFALSHVVAWALDGGGPAWRAVPAYLGISLVSSLFFCLMVAALMGQRPEGLPAAASPRFLERLPLKMRGAEIWAVEAEDHYLRLHTSKGQDLILMRLADAVAELEGIEGMQVHRSWWVARDAIVDARRGDGRATLTLKDGAQVPVSRTYAGMLRDRGWI